MRLTAKQCIRQVVLTSAIAIGIAVGFAVTSTYSYADPIPKGWMAKNMHPIGYSNLNGWEGAFKEAIRHVNGHWYLYLGNLWHRGWTIVDVTDPAHPQVAKIIPGPPNTWTIQMELHGNLMVLSVAQIQQGWGGDPAKPFEEGVLLYDISDPLNPKLLSHWKAGPAGTHRNGYPGGKYAYLSANMPGHKSNVLVILDVSDPHNPKVVSQWWPKGMGDDFFHGPPYVTADGNTAYLGYDSKVIVLDIHDKAHPKEIGELTISPPFAVGGLPLHDVKLIPGENLLFAHSEGIRGDAITGPQACDGPLPFVGLINIKDPTKPYLESVFPTPVPPKGLPYTDFCEKGARFGPHNTNLEYHLPDVEAQGNVIYLCYFNAGLQVFDIKDPHLPTISGYFIPPVPPERVGPIPAGRLVTQTEDVLVDTRGNIYITDKQWGLWILRYSGPDEPIGQSSEAQWRKYTGASSSSGR